MKYNPDLILPESSNLGDLKKRDFETIVKIISKSRQSFFGLGSNQMKSKTIVYGDYSDLVGREAVSLQIFERWLSSFQRIGFLSFDRVEGYELGEGITGTVADVKKSYSEHLKQISK